MGDATSTLVPAKPLSEESVPFANQTVVITRQEYIELINQNHLLKTYQTKAQLRIKELKEEYLGLAWEMRTWKAKYAAQEVILKEIQHEFSLLSTREELLQHELKHKEAIIRDLQQRLFGKRTEKRNFDTQLSMPKRPRGQQKGSKGHGRTPRANLPMTEETISLNQPVCPECGKKYTQLDPEESNIFEVEVRGYTRRIKREKFVSTCHCMGRNIITAPVPLKLLSKSSYGSSIWEEILINKFLYAQPLNRILNGLASLGIRVASGTIAGNLKRLSPLFLPIYQGFHEQQMTEKKFNNDETRWEVYEQVEGKVGHRWYLWVTRSLSVVYYCIDPTRSAAVPLKHFANLQSKCVIVICDRYGAYKKLARLNLAVIIAFCWAHVRRDFLDLARGHENLKDWCLDWVEDIADLYHLNNERVSVWDRTLPLIEQKEVFQEKHLALKTALDAMQFRCEKLLDADTTANDQKTSESLEASQRKVLLSLKKHWQGLTVFYDYPEIEMDNNLGEQSMRSPVLGRNGYYGSGSIWSAELAGIMFSIFQTLLLWKLNPRTWLRLYLETCLQNGGKPPQDLKSFFPWNMDTYRLQQLSQPPPVKNL
jgi:transposase